MIACKFYKKVPLITDIFIFKYASFRGVLVVHYECCYSISENVWFSSVIILFRAGRIIVLCLLFNVLSIWMSLLIPVHIHWRHTIWLCIHIGMCLMICIWIIHSLPFVSTKASAHLRNEYWTIPSSFLSRWKVIF